MNVRHRNAYTLKLNHILTLLLRLNLHLQSCPRPPHKSLREYENEMNMCIRCEAEVKQHISVQHIGKRQESYQVKLQVLPP